MLRKNRNALSFFWLICLFLETAWAFSPPVLGAGMVPRPESVRAVTETTDIGPPDPRRPAISRRTLKAAETSASMTFALALKMRNFSDLEARLAKGERISPQEMKAKYDPLPADYEASTKWLTAQGFTIIHQDPNRLGIFASGKVSQVQKSFQVTFARVVLGGKEYTSAITPPSVPDTISSALVGVNGLQPHLRPHKHATSRPLDLKKLAGSGQTFSYLPSQIATAYKATPLYNAGISGTGQTTAIVIDLFPSRTDLSSFWQFYDVNQSNSNVQFIQAVTSITDAPDTDLTETTLDVEWSSAIAPASQIRVYGSQNLDSDNLDTCYQAVYTDATTHPEYNIHQMSMSYGGGELDASSPGQAFADTQYFAELTSAGVTVFASSGDGGSSPGGAYGDTSGPTQVEYPASDPNVTGVGGTTVLLNPDNSISSEVGWSLGGGGYSTYFARPSWQSATGLSGTGRMVPDVALPADINTGADGYLDGSLVTFGGTSWSSPTFAGFCALINQVRANAGLPPIGLLAPRLYALSESANFNAITSGSNGGYSAKAGYDLVTGLGSPMVQALSQNLDVQTFPTISTLAPGQTATFTVTAGGTPTAYQWQRMPVGMTAWGNVGDTGAYSGATSAALMITPLTSAMSGDQFQCLVTNGSSTVTSEEPSVLVVDRPLIVTTLAGQANVPGTQDGTGTAAQLNTPCGVAVDVNGNTYVADYGSNTIRRITPDGVVTTPYASYPFNGPNSVAIDSAGNLYVADSGNACIEKISPFVGNTPGTVTVLAGSGVQTYQNGTGTAAAFNQPQGVTVDTLGNVYVADTANAVIRKITPGRVVSTFAGTPPTVLNSTPPKVIANGGWQDGTGTAAQFLEPISVVTDSSNNVYVGDLGDDVIRKITPAGVVTTPYGRLQTLGSSDGIGNNALFNGPIGLGIDSANNLYVTDSQLPLNVGQIVISNNLIRRINTNGVVSTIAGQTSIAGTQDGTGSGAQFNTPQSVTVDSMGTVIIADSFSDTIRTAVTTLPAITVTAPQPTATVYGSPSTAGQFTVTRSGSLFPTLTVNTTVGGTAISGLDYTALPGTITLSPGISSASITVNPLFDSAATTNRTVQLSPAASTTYTTGNPGSATVTIDEPTPYQSWQLSTFGANAYTPGISGDLADPNHNGVPNLLEYAFGANPLQAGTAPGPTTSVVNANGNQYLAITYPQVNDANVTYTVQVTSDLTQQTDTWHSGATYTTVVGTSGGQVTVRDNTPLAGATKRFIRVQVSGP